MIPRTSYGGDYPAFNANFEVWSVSDIYEFILSDSESGFFCDRFSFVYDLPLSAFNPASAHCRVSPNSQVGIYKPSFKNF